MSPQKIRAGILGASDVTVSESELNIRSSNLHESGMGFEQRWKWARFRLVQKQPIADEGEGLRF